MIKTTMKAEKKLTMEMWSQFFAREASFGCQKLKGTENMNLVNIFGGF